MAVGLQNRYVVVWCQE